MWIVENQRGFRERKKMEKRKRKEKKRSGVFARMELKLKYHVICRNLKF